MRQVGASSPAALTESFIVSFIEDFYFADVNGRIVTVVEDIHPDVAVSRVRNAMGVGQGAGELAVFGEVDDFAEAQVVI